MGGTCHITGIARQSLRRDICRGLGERAGLLRPLLAGAGVLGSAMLVVTVGGGAAAFVGGAIVLFMGIVFVVPYIYALLAGLDKAGRWASIGPAFVLTGWALGPGIAGVVIRGGDFTTLGYVALACVAVAMALFLCAQRVRLRAELASAAEANYDVGSDEPAHARQGARL